MHSIVNAKRIIIKIGSSLLVDEKSGKINHDWLASLIADVAACLERGQQIVIVSSGAIALGRRDLQFNNKNFTLKEKQAFAAIGQIKLAHAYESLFGKYNYKIAQILLTLQDSENRERYLNAKNTLETLLAWQVIPIINENDTVATAEIRFGDNDRLSARIAQMISADLLILLSDIEGLYTSDPKRDPKAKLLLEVTQLTSEILKMGTDSIGNFGSGGMVTKLNAAQICMTSGCKMVIAAGKYLHPLMRIDQVQEKTWFIPEVSSLCARKNWLAQHLQIKGNIILDTGAQQALRQGKSLLAVGVSAIDGHFQQGDAVNILDHDKKIIARGLINYSSLETNKIIGKKSSDFFAILGYEGNAEIIHRDNLVLLGEKN